MINRQQVKDKFGGKCGYCGKMLPEKFQIDHVYPKSRGKYKRAGFDDPDDPRNLVPCYPIINHYKRALSPKDFKKRIQTLHLRLALLPVRPRTEKSRIRKKYLKEVAGLFGITPSKPFKGKFYYEDHL